MSIFKKNLSKETLFKITLVSLVVLFAFVYIICDIVTQGPITSFLSNREAMIATVEQVGIFGPLIFILISVLQILLAPIPGQLITGIGGYVFGWWGILWSTIGGTLGYFIVILLSRKFGRTLLEKMFKKSAIEKFDFVFGDRAALILFLIFLLPGLPDDMVGYMAGLSNIPIKNLLVLVTVGHIPSIVITNYIGMGLGSDNLAPVIIISVVVALLCALAFIYREKMIDFLKNLTTKK